MIRHKDIKYVVWGTGKEHVPQLFNVTSDPEEYVNLALDPGYAPLIETMDAMLKKQIDYPKITMDVASYNIEMAVRLAMAP